MTELPGVIDSHVHLGLVDPAGFAGSPVVEVHDLGWLPAAAARWREAPPAGLAVRAAGPIHTAPGGYPFGRGWAPAGVAVAIRTPADARAAVAVAAAAGAHLVKVAHHTGMPTLDMATLRAFADAAHASGLPLGVHAEGPGAAAAALEAGADVLVHVPWTERIPDADLAAFAERTVWFSTLSIHRGRALATASDNAERFVSAGGVLRYGTDLGNGPRPAGLVVAEVDALAALGFDVPGLLGVLAPDPDAPRIRVDAPVPERPRAVGRWLSRAVRC